MDEARCLLDTDVCIYVVRAASDRLKHRLAEQDSGSLAISTITLAELEFGIRARPEQQPRLALFLSEVGILPFDERAARAYGRMPFRRGRNDHLIAAHALALGLTLVTNNERDFADIPGLKIENWTL